MVNGDHQDVFVGSQLNQTRSEQRANGKIERALRLRGSEPERLFLCVTAAMLEISEAQVHGRWL
jgi:hypothetical protein